MSTVSQQLAQGCCFHISFNVPTVQTVRCNTLSQSSATDSKQVVKVNTYGTHEQSEATFCVMPTRCKTKIILKLKTLKQSLKTLNKNVVDDCVGAHDSTFILYF